MDRHQPDNQPRTTDGTSSILVTMPGDATSTTELSQMVERCLGIFHGGRYRELHLDLSGVRNMNSVLLAVIILLAREASEHEVSLRLSGAGDQFRHWATTYGLWSHLEAMIMPSHDASIRSRDAI